MELFTKTDKFVLIPEKSSETNDGCVFVTLGLSFIKRVWMNFRVN